MSEKTAIGQGEVESEAFNVLKDFREKVAKKFRENTAARILSDLAFSHREGFFSCYLEGKRSFLFTIDPLVIDPMVREEVSLFQYKTERLGLVKYMSVDWWNSFPCKGSAGLVKNEVDVEEVKLDVNIDNKAALSATAELKFVSLLDGPRVIHLHLAPTLRVSKVTQDDGEECLYVQEHEKEDADFWVIMPAPLKSAQKHSLTITYSGKEVVEDVGVGNFYVGARSKWYPAFYSFYDRARYFITYCVPKGHVLISTGKLLNRSEEGGKSTSQWDSQIPFKVAGFNYGKFATEVQKDSTVEITSYANTGLQNSLIDLQILLKKYKGLRDALQLFPSELNTTRLAKNAAIESLNAFKIFTHFFGEIPFKSISVSQQPAGSRGQSWPTLIYPPFDSFFSQWTREKLGLVITEGDQLFYDEVAAHEIAHQWWGHMVGYNTYHDQWLSEGFATYSAGLYFQLTEGNDKFFDFLKLQRDRVLAKTERERRATELGPIWLGIRLRSFESPDAFRLVFSKGAYVLHMLRMMLFDHQRKSDERFIAMMKDYLKTHFKSTASTESFKAVAERHLGEDLDWFFDQWVYGTEVPTYRFDHLVEPTPDGKYSLTLKVTQEGVSGSFHMPIPFVVNYEQGHSVGKLEVQGSTTRQKTVILPIKPKSIVFNPWLSVLCEVK